MPTSRHRFVRAVQRFGTQRSAVMAVVVGLSLIAALASSPATARGFERFRAEVSGAPARVMAMVSAALNSGPLPATKVDTLIVDTDGDGKADPGDTIRYEVQVFSTPGHSGVDFSDTLDPNTTLVGGSVNASPLAFDDAYDTIGNTLLKVGVAATTDPEVVVPGGSLFNNDAEFLGDAFTLKSVEGVNFVAVSVTAATEQGGSVTVNASGSFTYLPPVGFSGVDNFDYLVTDDGVGGLNPLTGPGRVTLNVLSMVWYVKNNAVAGGLGRSTDPFDSLNEAEVASSANHTIYVFEGDGTTGGQSTGIALKDGQRLVGEGVALTMPVSVNGGPNPTTLRAAGSQPLLDNTTAGGSGVSAPNVIPIEIVGLSLQGNGNAIDMTLTGNASGSTAIKNNTIRGAGQEGVDINKAGTGTLTTDVQTNTWNTGGTHGGNAFDARTTAGQLNLTFSNNTNILSSANGVLLDGSGGGTLMVTGFANNSVHSNTLGTGVSGTTLRFDASAAAGYQQVSGGATAIGSPGNGVGVAGMVLTSATGDLAFTDLDIYADSGAGLQVTGSGAVNIGAGTGTRVTVAGGVANVEATNGPAVSITNVTIGLPFVVVKSTNSTTTGVSLVGANDGTSAATFSAGSGSAIVNATGIDFASTVNNATVTYDGTITDDVGTLVSLNANTGDTKTFRGAITDGDDGDGSGVSMTGNVGTTMRFEGGLVLSTGANPAFAATGGGTVEVCDESPCNPAATGALINKITTTSGTALNVASTTIGANDLEFRSISAGTGSGSAGNGIVLDTTGSSGGLIVKGTGTAGSGGTIQHKTGADGSLTNGIGIYLNSTTGPSFSWMQLNDFDNSAITGRSVTGFTLNSSVLNGVIGTTNVGPEGPINFGVSNPGGSNGLQGTGLIHNTKVSGGVEHNLEFYNQIGNMNLTIDGTVAVNEGANPLSGADDVADCIIEENSVALGSDGIQVEMQNTSTATVVIDRCLFRDNKSQAVQVSALNTTNVTLTIDESVARKFDQGNEGFILSNGGDSDFTLMVSNNRLNNYGGTAIFVGQVPGNATAASSLHASVIGNIVNQPTTATNHGISALLTSTVGQLAPVRVRIDGNNVTNNSTSGTTRGIIVDTPDASTSPVYHATVTNNTVSVGDNVAGVAGLIVQARQSSDGCANIGSNTVTFPNGTPGGVFGLRARQVAPATYDLEQSVACTGTPAAVLACRNPASTTEVLGTLTVVPAGSCLLPSTP